MDSVIDKRLAACIPLTAALVGWLLTPESYPTELAWPPPAHTNITKNGWEGVPWTPFKAFSDEERRRFEREGFALLRDFLSPALVHKMLQVHEFWCPRGVPSPHWHCKNEDVWARTDCYRDFLYWGPIGPTVKSLLNVRAVRIYGDHVTEMRTQHKGIFYHFDNTYYGGVLGEFNAQSKGAVVFVFLSHVRRNTTGGSVLLQPGGHKADCVFAGVDPSMQEPCRKKFYDSAISLNFNPGDVLIIHPLMPHATQPPVEGAPGNLRRISYLARLVETDAVYCVTDTQVRETGKVDCRHDLRPGDKAHHVCYQQIAPHLEGETLRRFRSDWYPVMCNIYRGWRYTSLTRLKLRAREIYSQLRIRLAGGVPMGLERAECIYSPETLGLL